MRNLFILICFLMCFPVGIYGIPPSLQVYFDEGFSQPNINECRGMNQLDTLYVVARNFNVDIISIEFRIEYPPEFTWIQDLGIPANTLGNTSTGLRMEWDIPQSGTEPLLILKLLVLWNCDDCFILGHQLFVQANPLSGRLGAERYPDRVFIDAIPLESLVCGILPIDQTTWGRVKAIYQY